MPDSSVRYLKIKICLALFTLARVSDDRLQDSYPNILKDVIRQPNVSWYTGKFGSEVAYCTRDCWIASEMPCPFGRCTAVRRGCNAAYKWVKTKWVRKVVFVLLQRFTSCVFILYTCARGWAHTLRCTQMISLRHWSENTSQIYWSRGSCEISKTCCV